MPEPEPGEGEVLIKVSRAGMNFADTHKRENSYLARYETPMILGGEVAGETSDGRRVIALLPNGGYAEYAVAHEAAVYEIPDGLDEGAALALLIQGLTAWHLYRTCAKVAPGESWSWCRAREAWARWRCSSGSRSGRPGDRNRLDSREARSDSLLGRRRGRRSRPRRTSPPL